MVECYESCVTSRYNFFSYIGSIPDVMSKESHNNKVIPIYKKIQTFDQRHVPAELQANCYVNVVTRRACGGKRKGKVVKEVVIKFLIRK